MAPLESLLPYIYHERQQEGSMLCAEHALNNLFQGPYFTTTDLSQIAHALDEREREERYDDADRPRGSMNMDDTGFFSVQVLENALQVWGLTLVPWRSERMRPYHDHPHTQLAFILNCSQHWYTLRRFGRVSPHPSLEADPGGGHWFDLNSFLPEPQWVGKMYLGMVLQQAEAEGYSVFAVVQINPDGPLALPRTEGDELAQTLAEPSEAWYQHHALAPPRPPAAPAAAVGGHHDDLGFEDEDLELQAALQASLMNSSGHTYGTQGQSSRGQLSQGEHYNVPITSEPSQAPQSSRTGHYRVPITTSSDPGSEVHTPADPSQAYSRISRGYDVLRPRNDVEEDDEDLLPVIQDPVAASRARAQALMEQARLQQEAALRDTYEEDEARIRAGLPSRRNTRQQQEEADLQRAIEESRALHEAQSGHATDSDDDMEDDEDLHIRAGSSLPPASTHRETHRVYDDDDAELQAALKASLENVPHGFRLPSPPPQPQRPPATAPPQNPTTPKATLSDEPETETESEMESNIEEEQSAELSLEEMRRRRLERFGG